jgi:hypothetical protein
LNLKLENGFGRPHKSRGNPANERRLKMKEWKEMTLEEKLKEFAEANRSLQKGGEKLIALLQKKVERANRMMAHKPEHWAQVKEKAQKDIQHVQHVLEMKGD